MYDTDALAPGATIPQRLDRLPLTWTLWRLGLVTQAGWAVVVATDAIAAYLPVHLRPPSRITYRPSCEERGDEHAVAGTTFLAGRRVVI